MAENKVVNIADIRAVWVVLGIPLYHAADQSYIFINTLKKLSKIVMFLHLFCRKFLNSLLAPWCFKFFNYLQLKYDHIDNDSIPFIRYRRLLKIG